MDQRFNKAVELKNRILKQESVKRADSVVKPKSLFVTIEEHRKTVQALEEQVAAKNAKVAELQVQIQRRKSVFLRRQVQFKEIIKRFQEDFGMSRNLPAQLKQLNQCILSGVNATKEVIVDCTQEFIARQKEKFERRVQETYHHFKGIVDKEHRLSKELQAKMLSLFETTRQMASKVYDENARLHTQVKQLRFKNQIILDERNMLVNELMAIKLRKKPASRRKSPAKEPSRILSISMASAKHEPSEDREHEQRRRASEIKDSCMNILERRLTRERRKSKQLLNSLIDSHRNMSLLTQPQYFRNPNMLLGDTRFLCSIQQDTELHSPGQAIPSPQSRRRSLTTGPAQHPR